MKQNSLRWISSLVLLMVVGCTRPAHTAPYINFSQLGSPTQRTSDPSSPDPQSYLPPTREPDRPIQTPTPSPPQPLPTLRAEEVTYIVRWGDTLKSIAERFRVLPRQISQVNDIENPSLIYNGQRLIIPAPTLAEQGPGFKIIPDSELVYGPYTVHFDIPAVVDAWAGALVDYQEELDGRSYTGAEILHRVAVEYSVNPRLLLAVLEHQSGWVTQTGGENEAYPLQYREAGYEGLYRQLSWAANQLNRGYYLWRVRGVGGWMCQDGVNVPVDQTINAGTAGVQHLFSQLTRHPGWLEAVSEEGLFATYRDLFGYPFDYQYTPLIPADLSQPNLQLPFEDDVVWAFTGGPHGGWGAGSAWAALDFAPPPGNQGCVQSEEWVVAAAAGEIVYADQGAVVQSINGDSYHQTGWTLLYMHIDSQDRVEPGTYLEVGDRIGHPSCEGGVSTGTHLHLARRYNGEWIPADQHLPFDLDGWVSQGAGSPYQGSLVRGEVSLQAEDHRTDVNLIHR